jgi:CubicO group peptidase (beta-lactamase class C family)
VAGHAGDLDPGRRCAQPGAPQGSRGHGQLSAAVDALIARSRRDVDDGTLPSCQIALARGGELIACETFGAPADARYVTFSVTKAFSASLAWLMIGAGLVRDSTRVADVIPEFAANGKQGVTIEHLLTHTAGFPRAPMRPEEGADRACRVARLESWRLDWEPGSRTEYHATSAYWALAEVIDRVSGTDFRDLFAARIAGPLGVPGLTMGATQQISGSVVPIEVVGVAALGNSLGDKLGETSENFLLRFNEPAVLAAGVPGAGAVGTAADVALFYQGLLHNPAEIWRPDILADGVGRVRNTLVDPLFNVPVNRTLGLVVAGDDGQSLMRGFGSSVGPRTFGAMGVGGQIAWADPDSGLSFSYLTNGLDADVVGAFKRAAKIAGLAGRAVVPTQ